MKNIKEGYLKKRNIILNNFFVLEFCFLTNTKISASLKRKDICIGSFYMYLDKDKDNGYLDSFLINEEYKRYKYGMILSDSVKKLSKEIKISSLYLNAYPFNHSSLNEEELIIFYKKYLDMNITEIDNELKGRYMVSKIKNT